MSSTAIRARCSGSDDVLLELVKSWTTMFMSFIRYHEHEGHCDIDAVHSISPQDSAELVVQTLARVGCPCPQSKTAAEVGVNCIGLVKWTSLQERQHVMLSSRREPSHADCLSLPGCPHRVGTRTSIERRKT